jgi:hypothetical protein
MSRPAEDRAMLKEGPVSELPDDGTPSLRALREREPAAFVERLDR